MTFTPRHPAIAVLLLTIIGATAAFAQQIDTIRANPHAVKLRKIWMVRGSVNGGDEVGDGVGGLGDIFGTGYSAWGVHYGKLGQWRVYKGGPEPLSTEPVWTMDSSYGAGVHPVVGHFTDDGKPLVGFMHGENRVIAGHTRTFFSLRMFGVDSGHIGLQPSYILDPSKMTPGVLIDPGDIMAVDLDNDGYDDLVMVVPILLRDGQSQSYNGEIWIYKGGPGFQVDTPSVVIRDDEQNTSRFYAVVGSFEARHQHDLLLGGIYATGAKLKFFWGPNWFSKAGASPDRVVTLTTSGHPRIGYGLTTLDCDGDSVDDLWLPGPDGRVYLYRMGISTKDARTRPLDVADADAGYYRSGFIEPVAFGYLSDSTGRYAMAAILGPSQFNGQSEEVLAFAGGPAGPDPSYDAYYDVTLDGLIEGSGIAVHAPIGDCSGDGWPDILVANSGWYGENTSGNPGIAMILAGGPYIPRDSLSLGVHDVAVAGKAAGLSYWPNPVHDELHVAWRGDLKQMPAIMEVHDLLGRLIAREPLASASGSGVWQCSAVPAGTYMVSLFDRQGRLIAANLLVKQ